MVKPTLVKRGEKALLKRLTGFLSDGGRAGEQVESDWGGGATAIVSLASLMAGEELSPAAAACPPSPPHPNAPTGTPTNTRTPPRRRSTARPPRSRSPSAPVSPTSSNGCVP